MNPFLLAISLPSIALLILGIVLALLILLPMLAPAMAAAAVYVNEGKRILYSNTGSAIASKDVVVVASGTSGRIGIALTAIDATTGTGVLDIAGRHTLPKASGEAMTQLQAVYWDGTQISGTSTTTSTRAGRVAAAAASAATTVDVIIDAV
jgi:predicted RecA/RadA family phage recombinase